MSICVLHASADSLLSAVIAIRLPGFCIQLAKLRARSDLSCSAAGASSSRDQPDRSCLSVLSDQQVGLDRRPLRVGQNLDRRRSAATPAGSPSGRSRRSRSPEARPPRESHEPCGAHDGSRARARAAVRRPRRRRRLDRSRRPSAPPRCRRGRLACGSIRRAPATRSARSRSARCADTRSTDSASTRRTRSQRPRRPRRRHPPAAAPAAVTGVPRGLPLGKRLQQPRPSASDGASAAVAAASARKPLAQLALARQQRRARGAVLEVALDCGPACRGRRRRREPARRSRPATSGTSCEVPHAPQPDPG